MTKIKKTVLITGSSSGIGEATARLLASTGMSVVLASRNTSAMEAICADILRAGGSAVFIETDVRNREDLKSATQFALTQFSRLDVLINNAGVAPISKFDDLKVDDWDAMIDVNLRGVLHGIAAALPIFRQQNSGHIINVISTAGLTIVPTMGVYAATKNAVRTLSEALRQEAGPNLRVTGISPGYVKTNLQSSMTNADIQAGSRDVMEKIGIAPESVARAIAFAIEQPADIDIGDIVIRPTAQA
ncbi:MAG: SDR family oxidoreductase [Proteobacteria bacterium]|nr:MAG: SDR family oxidoreductase [Pseudomonadota bacterium]